MTEKEKKAIAYIKKDLEKAEYLDLQIVNTDKTSIEKTLNLIEKQQKALENSVPKEVLRNLIKELKNEISKNDKMIVEYRSTIEENRLEKEAKIDKSRFDNLIYYNEIRILKEILGE